MKIRTKLTVRFTALVASLFISLMILVQVVALHYWEEEFYVRLENRAVSLANLLLKVNEVDSSILRLIDLNQKDRPANEHIRIYNQHGALIYSQRIQDTSTLPISMVQAIRLHGPQKMEQGKTRVLGFQYLLDNKEYFIMASGNDRVAQVYLNKMLKTRILLALFSIGLVAIAGWYFSGRSLRPLKQVTDEVNNLSPDMPGKRLQASAHQDEIGVLVSTFNSLLQRIDDTFSMQKVFLSGASHEIRNPLTSITAQMQVLLLKNRPEEEYRMAIRSVLEDLAQLNKTTDDLIQYSSLNQESDAMAEAKPLRIDEVIWYCYEYFQKSKPMCAVRLDLFNLPDNESKLMVYGNENLLRIALINLLDNACKFSRDQAARVRIHHERGFVQVVVADNGVGMPPDVVNMIFEPFYRANHTSRLRGHGIGLSLVKRILDLHQASVVVNSELGRGSIFTVSFQPFPPTGVTH